MGWACAELGEKINLIVKQYDGIRKRDELIHNILKKVYGDNIYELARLFFLYHHIVLLLG
jgi:hypothetical protein